MNLEHYDYFTDKNFKDYEFYSDGPNGRIKKVVSYIWIDTIDDTPVYNLGFGDRDTVTGIISDTAITNNRDRDLVLATVANTILDFYDHYGDCYIFARGSTSARTRLYQMGIAGLWKEIKNEFDVQGLKEEEWHDFERNVNYEAFLVKKK